MVAIETGADAVNIDITATLVERWQSQICSAWQLINSLSSNEQTWQLRQQAANEYQLSTDVSLQEQITERIR